MMRQTRNRRFNSLTRRPQELNPAVERILLMGRDQMEMNPFSQKVWDWWANEFHRINFLPQNARSQTVARHLTDVPVDMSPSSLPKKPSKSDVKRNIQKNDRSKMILPKTSVNTVEMPQQESRIVKESVPRQQDVKKAPKVDEIEVLKKRVGFLSKELEMKNKELSKTQEKWFEQFKQMEKHQGVQYDKKQQDPGVNDDVVGDLKKKISSLESELKKRVNDDSHRKLTVEIMSKEKEKIIASSTDIIKALQLLAKLEKELQDVLVKLKQKYDEKLVGTVLENIELSIRVVKNLHFKAVDIWGSETLKVKENEDDLMKWVKEKQVLMDQIDKLKKENESLRSNEFLKTPQIGKSVTDYLKAKY